MGKKTFIQITLLFLCVSAIFSASGCKNKSNPTQAGDTMSTKIRWLVYDDIQTPDPDFINQYLKEKELPYEIEFVGKPSVNYREAITAAKEAGEEIDLVFTGYYEMSSYWSPYYDLIADNALLPLNKMLETDLGSELQAAYNEKVWEALNVEGNVYGVSTNFIVPWQKVAVYNEALVEKYDIDPAVFQKPIWEWEDALKKVADGEGDGFVPMVFLQIIADSIPHFTTVESIDFLYTNESDDALEVVNIYDTEAGKKAWSALQDYIKKGYMQTKTQYEESSENGDLGNGNYFVWITSITSDSYFNENPDWYPGCSFVKMGDKYVGTNLNVSPIGIASWSKQPEEAFTLLASIMSDPDLTNAFVWGKESVSYSLAGGHAVKQGTTGEYLPPKYDFGNMFLAHPILGDPTNKKEDYDQIITEAKKSKLFGFHFDGTSVASEINATFQEVQKWGNAYTVNIDDINSYLNTAGMQKILDEANRQLQAWQDKQ